ncbi:MAG TPA: hypothetical protein VKZ51_01340, partial [Cyclobacteriaceae bacterium]|nr:hypothetical protein [Cyclobacteriaceae bacterium]
MNPLLEKFDTPFETPPFEKIKTAHFLPAVEAAIQEAKREIEDIKNTPDPDFHQIIEALDLAGSRLNTVSAIFFNLNAADTNPEIQKLAREISPMITRHSNDILLDALLFQKVKSVYDQKEHLDLDEEQQTLLEKTYRSFVRNGANLDEEDKARLRAIDEELSQMGLKFGENVLEETNKYELLVDDKDDLKGLPEDLVESAAQE